ncbi:MAG: motility protein A [Firmicutes bacterium]|nr:motility protein A [Bacillota bacterium]
MKRFDSMTWMGIVIGLGLVLIGIKMEGNLNAFWNLSGLLITVGGSFGALMVNFRKEEIKAVFQVTRQAFVRKDESVVDLNHKFVYLTKKARREGLLVLEDELPEIEDPFFRNGLQMVIDGFEPEAIQNILLSELEALADRHELGQSLYRTWGNLAPAFGMIGTLIGLVMMLGKLEDPSAIGPGMAVALLTTFYGVILANLVFLPLAGKLSIYSKEEINRKEIVIKALLALQSGVNPRLMEEHLKAYFTPAERRQLEEGKKEREEPEGVIFDA